MSESPYPTYSQLFGMFWLSILIWKEIACNAVFILNEVGQFQEWFLMDFVKVSISYLHTNCRWNVRIQTKLQENSSLVLRFQRRLVCYTHSIYRLIYKRKMVRFKLTEANFDIWTVILTTDDKITFSIVFIPGTLKRRIY